MNGKAFVVGGIYSREIKEVVVPHRFPIFKLYATLKSISEAL